jgi:ribose transport system ATP-binding protein
MSVLSVTGISKRFPGVQALSDLSLEVAAGEIHALVGENGAGKSTLTKIIAGVQAPDEGEIRLDGRVVKWRGPAEAKAAGIHVIYQEFVLFPHLTVAENIFIGQAPRSRIGFLDGRGAVTAAREVLGRMGVTLDPGRLVDSLTVADQQMVEIAKALVHRPKLLILDEPTAVIAGQEVVLLFERLRRLRNEGVAIIYISHRLEEIFQLCDRLTVVKDGRLVGSKAVSDVTRPELITMMVGRDLSHLFPPKLSPTAAQMDETEVLSAEGIVVAPRVRGAGLKLQAGVITGLAGLVGAGRSELAMAIFGGTKMQAGSVTVGGRTFTSITPPWPSPWALVSSRKIARAKVSPCCWMSARISPPRPWGTCGAAPSLTAQRKRRSPRRILPITASLAEGHPIPSRPCQAAISKSC